MVGELAHLQEPGALRSLHETFPATTEPEILLVDQERRAVAPLAVALRGEGYLVIEIGWLADFFEFFRQPLCSCGATDFPDLIVANLDGFPRRVALKLLTDLTRAGPGTRLILMASAPDRALRRKVDELPWVHLLEKPCSAEDVRDLALSLVRPN